MRTIICNQLNLLTFWKRTGKGKNIANGRSTKTVKSLVLISDHEKVFRLTARGKQGENALLDIVGILVFINKHIPDILSNLLKSVRLSQEVIGTFLQVREIN